MLNSLNKAARQPTRVHNQQAGIALRPSVSFSGGRSSIFLSGIDDAFYMIGLELGSSEMLAAIIQRLFS